MILLADAYAKCEAITKAEAKNFAYGIRLLPDQKRQAMSALYAFARRVDDVGDGSASNEEKLAELGRLRDQIVLVAKAEPPDEDPVLIALSDAAERYSLPTEALEEIVAGCELDSSQSHYETYEDLEQYCRYVAGSVGRLSLAVFGSSAENAPYLADVLGIVLQITNILRDIIEDRDVMGRVYLPQEDLRRFSCSSDVRGSSEDIAALVRFEAGRATERYQEGLALLKVLDHRSRSCVAAMAGIYHRLLDRIERVPLSVFSRRVSLSGREKAWVAARSLVGLGV